LLRLGALIHFFVRWTIANFPRVLAQRQHSSGESEDWSIIVYAVIRSGNRQYRAEVGKTIDVERLPYEINHSFDIDDVLLVGDGDNTVVGMPLVEGAKVKATVVDQYRAKKVIVFKYRQRTNYRRKRGHRQYYTRLHIDEIIAK
jgi:large subunit ribosomal protein L21